MNQSGASGKKEWLIRIALVLASCAVALMLSEVVARIFFPISDRLDYITLDGRPIKGWFEPGIVYRQISNEYDARTSITPKGHRVPGSEGTPEVIFIGDSFTYGFGLSDEETFASIYCSKRHLDCANLGWPGSGTDRHVKRLEEFIQEWGWKPREVKLFFFGMSNSFSSGNDFVDNYYSYMDDSTMQPGADRGENRHLRSESATGFGERLIGFQSLIIEHSALMRFAKFYWGPLLKSLVLADPGERMTVALAATKQYLRRLDELSRQVGFEYNIYLLVPVQDIMRGTHGETLDTLNRVSPKRVIPTAHLFLDAPRKYYYAFDGHINSLGSQRIADFVISSDQAQVNGTSARMADQR